jgi:hypothetical protein
MTIAGPFSNTGGAVGVRKKRGAVVVSNSFVHSAPAPGQIGVRPSLHLLRHPFLTEPVNAVPCGVVFHHVSPNDERHAGTKKIPACLF